MDNFRRKRDFGERPSEPAIIVKAQTKVGTNIRGAIMPLGRSRWQSLRRGQTILVDGMMKTVHDLLWVAKNELHLVLAN